MMIDIAAAVAGQVARLVAGGVPATADPRNVNPPMVLVLPPSLAYQFANRADAAFIGLLVGPGGGAMEALRAMSEMVAKMQTILTATEAFPVDKPNSVSGGYDTAYQIVWQEQLRG